MKDGSKRESVKQAERESGTKRDVKGMPHEHISKSAHAAMHKPNHEFGECHEGTTYHDHHRGKD